MQKVLRINLANRSHAIKKTRKAIFFKRKAESKEYDQWRQGADKMSNQYIKDERKARREDWIQGPLAPDRDTGLTQGRLGALDPVLMQSQDLPGHVRGGPREAQYKKGRWMGLRHEETWEGVGNHGNIVVGDRVCVVRGDDRVKGRIGMVTELQSEKGLVLIEGVNVADVQAPIWASPAQTQGRAFHTIEGPILLNDVRLVYRMTFPSTGREEDVIIRSLRGGAPHEEPTYGSNRPWHTRYISGTDTRLEWPEEEIKDFTTEAADTVRKDVDDETYGFMPSLLERPLPKGVEGELVNKYSKKRVMHDESYVVKKVLEDARSKWYEKRELVAAPWLEKKRLELKQRQERGHGVSEQAIWELVGREMEESRKERKKMEGKVVLSSSNSLPSSETERSLSAN